MREKRIELPKSTTIARFLKQKKEKMKKPKKKEKGKEKHEPIPIFEVPPEY